MRLAHCGVCEFGLFDKPPWNISFILTSPLSHPPCLLQDSSSGTEDSSTDSESEIESDSELTESERWQKWLGSQPWSRRQWTYFLTGDSYVSESPEPERQPTEFFYDRTKRFIRTKGWVSLHANHTDNVTSPNHLHGKYHMHVTCGIPGWCQYANVTNPTMHPSHIPQCTIQNRNMHILFWMLHCGTWNRCIVGFVVHLASCIKYRPNFSRIPPGGSYVTR